MKSLADITISGRETYVNPFEVKRTAGSSAKKPFKIPRLKLSPPLIQHHRKFEDVAWKKNEEAKVHFLAIEHVALNPQFRRFLSVFVSGMLILASVHIVNIFYTGLTLKDIVFQRTLSGAKQMITIPQKVKESDFLGIYGAFQNAYADFEKAGNDTWMLKLSSDYLNLRGDVQSTALSIISVGKHISSAGVMLGKSFTRLESLKDTVLLSINEQTRLSDSLTDLLKKEFDFISKANQEIQSAKEAVNSINFDKIPLAYQKNSFTLQKKVNFLAEYSSRIEKHFPAFLNFLGDRLPRKYLVLFANNNEQRAIMGFLGNGMILEFNDGWITKNQIFDIYHFDGQIVDKIQPPEVFERITANWGVRDSNYSPDGRISAQQAAYLFEKAGGEGVDGVIFADLHVIKEILAITGPIKISGVRKPLNADTIDQVLSYIIESKLDGAEDPKSIIKKLWTELVQKLAEQKNYSAFMNVLAGLMREKHIIAYSKFDDIQDLFRALKISGEITQSADNEDYLSVINTSLSGNKSDYYMKESLQQKTTIQPSGIIVNQLAITRQHAFSPDDSIKIDSLASEYGLPKASEELKKILGAGENVVSVRVYVPKGSRLKNVIGKKFNEVEIRYDKDLNLVYFQTLLITQPGQSSSAVFVYELPFQLDFDGQVPLDTYYFTVQKQAGTKNRILEKEILFPLDMKVYKKLPNNSTLYQKGKLIYSFDLNIDRKMGIIVGY